MSKRVLIADDIKDIADTFGRRMESDYDIEIIYNSNQVERMHIINNYDVIVIDNIFPSQLSGLEVIEFIRENDQDVKLILITAFADEDVKKRAKDLGASIITKPVDYDRIKEIIEAM